MSRDLQAEFPEMKGFFLRNLKYMRQWFRFWSTEPSIGQQLVAQIPRGHNLVIRALVPQPVTPCKKHQQQYPAIDVQRFQLAHDRFLIIDNDIYHIGASLKDLGKKWFAFSKMAMDAIKLLAKVKVDG